MSHGFREDHVIVLQIGSFNSCAINGISESISVPSVRLRTVVGRLNDGSLVFGQEAVENACLNPTSSGVTGTGADRAEDVVSNGADRATATETGAKTGAGKSGLKDTILPVVKGQIVDWEMFEKFVEHLLNEHLNYANPPTPINTFPIALVTPSSWSQDDKERVTHMFFEKFLVPAFYIIEDSLASLFAYGRQTGLVIDIGYETTTITAIEDSQIIDYARVTYDKGGNDVTQYFKKLLLNSVIMNDANSEPISKDIISDEMVEFVKCSSICECIPADGIKVHDSEPEVENKEEGIIDVAAIIASGRTREYLAQKEKERHSGVGQIHTQENHEKKFNQVEYKGMKLSIGSERFHVMDQFLDNKCLDGVPNLIDLILLCVQSTCDISRRNELWENIVLVGNGSQIHGFSEALQVILHDKFVVTPPEESINALANYSISGGSGTSTPAGITSSNFTPGLLQPIKTSIIQFPSYFSEWKEHSHVARGEASFLGAQLAAKFVFNDNNNGSYITRQDYSNLGPSIINSI